jgi:4-hydroxy-tetrahydrodipicolinate reductase
VRVAVFGLSGKFGSALATELRAAHELVNARSAAPSDCDVGLEITRPDVATRNVQTLLAAGLPVVIGTSNIDQAAIDRLARNAELPCLYAPNFSIGAVLMIKFAIEAARQFPHSEIVEYHDHEKVDAPSGTANATAAAMGSSPPIHSIRLPGFISKQAVLFGATGEVLTIEHETSSYLAFAPGVRLALSRVALLPLASPSDSTSSSSVGAFADWISGNGLRARSTQIHEGCVRRAKGQVLPVVWKLG